VRDFGYLTKMKNKKNLKLGNWICIILSLTLYCTAICLGIDIIRLIQVFNNIPGEDFTNKFMFFGLLLFAIYGILLKVLLNKGKWVMSLAFKDKNERNN